MYTNAGYLNNDETNLEDLTCPLRINSCGVYRLISRTSMFTLRQNGRRDYQLLYIASGRIWFTFEDREAEITAGNMVLYRPGEYQKYVYYLEDETEVYWIHFTGYEAGQLLEQTGFKESQILYTGISYEYARLFSDSIRELQVSRPHFDELLILYLKQLLAVICRHVEEGPNKSSRVQNEIETAVHYFNEHYAEIIEIEQYAKKRHVSICWFIRSFKHYVGMPPLKYLTSIRINRAKELLETTDYNIGEIAELTGYENALYFSRIFKKTTGKSPSDYRNSSYR